MNLWPEYYGVAADHCQDVLEGCYDVDYNYPENITILDIGANGRLHTTRIAPSGELNVKETEETGVPRE